MSTSGSITKWIQVEAEFAEFVSICRNKESQYVVAVWYLLGDPLRRASAAEVALINECFLLGVDEPHAADTTILGNGEADFLDCLIYFYRLPGTIDVVLCLEDW